MTIEYEKIGKEVGALVQSKQRAYGDSFSRASEILEVLYPDGIVVSKYRDMLAVCRVIDKLFRIANQKDYADESPWQDIAGYGILGYAKDKKKLDYLDQSKVDPRIAAIKATRLDD